MDVCVHVHCYWFVCICLAVSRPQSARSSGSTGDGLVGDASLDDMFANSTVPPLQYVAPFTGAGPAAVGLPPAPSGAGVGGSPGGRSLYVRRPLVLGHSVSDLICVNVAPVIVLGHGRLARCIAKRR
jgi:hypothetical protein